MIYYGTITLKKPAVCFKDMLKLVLQADDTDDATRKLNEFIKSQSIEALNISIRPIKLNDSSIILLKSNETVAFTLKESKPIEQNKDKETPMSNIEKALKTKMPFGKYKDYTLEQLMQEDSISYLHWLLQAGTAKGLLATSLEVLKDKIEYLYTIETEQAIDEDYADALASCLPNT